MRFHEEKIKDATYDNKHSNNNFSSKFLQEARSARIIKECLKTHIKKSSTASQKEKNENYGSGKGLSIIKV